MHFLYKQITIANRQISLSTIIWFTLAAIGAIAELSRGENAINNYLIFKGVFWHSVNHQPLYLEYPAEYFDNNHYGPAFSILIAPFALLPNIIGCFLWCLANAFMLWYAIKTLPVSSKQIQIILWIAAIEMMTSVQNVQFNPMLTGFIILAYTMLKKEKTIWATLFIAMGFLFKIYGIVGLAFFFFTKDKLRFIVSFLFWVAVLFFLPMLFSSFDFVIQAYTDWFNKLGEKNAKNADAIASNYMQDISVMGMIRRIFKVDEFSNLIVLAPAALAYLLPFIRIKQISKINFQLHYLALALIGVVIFSTSAESATYVIAIAGVAIWFVINEQKSLLFKVLLVLVFILTILSPTDLFPASIRMQFVRPYSLKALPCFLVWVVIVFQLLKNKFATSH